MIRHHKEMITFRKVCNVDTPNCQTQYTENIQKSKTWENDNETKNISEICKFSLFLTLNLTPVDQKYSKAEKRAKNDVSMNWQIFAFLDPQILPHYTKKISKRNIEKAENYHVSRHLQIFAVLGPQKTFKNKNIKKMIEKLIFLSLCKFSMS